MDQQYITKETLESFGITLSHQDEESLIEHLNETLQERIGAEVAAALSEEKLKQLIEFQDTATDEQVGAWLTQNIPELPQIAEDEIAILMGELQQNTDAINKSAA